MLARRQHLLSALHQDFPSFEQGSRYIQKALRDEIDKDGTDALLEHLASCGVIPELLQHDSTEEKLFSKYTDMLLAETFRFLGFQAKVLDERSDAADIEISTRDYQFVADAKAFRLSRTAKNQKDFKVGALAGWRKHRHYSLLVAPLFQDPHRASQIYAQATQHNVCLLSYTHIQTLVSARVEIPDLEIEKTVQALLGSSCHEGVGKDASRYWLATNQTLRSQAPGMKGVWEHELERTEQVLEQLKKLEAEALAEEEDRIRQLSHEEAVQQLIKARRIDERQREIQKTSRNDLFEL